MNFTIPIKDVIFSACTFLFPFWPLLVIAPIRGRDNLVVKMLVVWAFAGVVRLVLVFSPLPLMDFLIPEPWNTAVYIFVGVVLVGIWCARRVKK
jgi:hypothetical protein